MRLSGLYSAVQQRSSRRRSVERATRPIVEALERRQLLAVNPSGYQVNLNFGLDNAATLPGYEPEHGAAYRGGHGFDYGFSSAVYSGAADRNSVNAPDQRYDTFIETQYQSGNYSWEIGLPNGTYTVKIVAGDPDNYSGHTYVYDAEGTNVVSGTPTSGNRFISGTASISVSDGRLTITNGTGAQNNKIAFIEITPSTGTVNAAPTNLVATPASNTGVDLRWTDWSDGETGFVIERKTGAGSWTQIATTLPNARTYLDSGLSSSTTYEYRVKASDGTNSSAWSNKAAATTRANNNQAPYGGRSWVVGGSSSPIIQFEDFDTGGSAIAMNDGLAGNAGGYYRLSDVDIGRVRDADGYEDGYKVGWNKAGDWTEYTLDVQQAGSYRVEVRLSSKGQGGKFEVSFDGAGSNDLTITNLQVPDTGSFQSYQLFTQNITLPTTGPVVMQLKAIANEASNSWVGDFDWVRLVPLAGQTTPPDAPPPGGTGRRPALVAESASLFDDPDYGGAGGLAGARYSGIAEAGVRYFDGAVQHEVTDLLSNGFGMPWGHTRGWTNQPGYVSDVPNGNGWVVDQMPSVREVDSDTVAVVTGANEASLFDLVSGSYVARHFDQQKLVHDGTAKTFTLTDKMGRKWLYHNFDSSFAAAKKGSFSEYSDPHGNVTQVTSRNGDGRITEVQRSDGSGLIESFAYGYYDAGENAGKLQQITWRRQGSGGPWQGIRTSHYAYYGSSDSGGNLGDLKTATIKDANSNVIDNWYYRYWKAPANGSEDGYEGAVKYIVSPKSYERADAEISGGILASTDAALAPYADQFFEYDSAKRVKKHTRQGEGCSTCTGGLGTFTYDYFTSSHADGRGNWRTRTTETRPDGSKQIVYTNVYGQTLLEVERPTGAAAGGEWLTFYEYDSSGRLVTIAAPSAVSGYDETKADLLEKVSGNYVYLNDSSGLIQTRSYYASTTATSTTAGGVLGYADSVYLKRGETTTAIVQSKEKYKLKTIGSDTIAPVAESIVYRNTDGTGAITTTHDYTFYTDSFQPRSVKVTHPIVTVAQNGPGGSTGDQETTVYDDRGRPIWFRDGGGYLTYIAYDNASGGFSQLVVDVDETQLTVPSEISSGLPSDNGLHLVHGFFVDALGRPTKYTDPAGKISYTVYKDADQEVRTYLGWDASLFGGSGGPTGPTVVSRFDRDAGYAEELTMSAQPAVSGGAPTGGESIGGVQSLSRNHFNAAWQATQADRYFSLSGLTYSDSASLGTQNTHFYRAEYAYDDRGRLKRTLSPSGTIYRTVYDGLGRPTSSWVGLDDVPTSGFWSPTNTGGTDLVKTSELEWDGGGIGDWNLTKQTLIPGGGADDRVTAFYYDWRNRLVAAKNGVQGSENTGVQRRIAYNEYDNLDQVTAVTDYDGDNVSITSSNGVPNAPSTSLRRARSVFSYDEQGRVYKIE